MARPLCIQYEGALYHVTSRGNARADIFHDDFDREIFLDAVAKAYAMTVSVSKSTPSS